MSRLDIKTASKAQTVVDRLYKDMERRIASSPPGLCPIDMSLTFLQLCHAQSCGKCVPCRIGLGQLAALMGQVLDGTGTMLTIDTIEKTARAIVASADCAIGRDAAQLVLSGFEGFRDDYVNHVQHHRCLASLQNPVPCVSLCPAGVDVPGYVALVREGRYADAVRLIRKDNPMPTACAYICEHPCEASDAPRAGRPAAATWSTRPSISGASSAMQSIMRAMSRILPAGRRPANASPSSAAARAGFLARIICALWATA